MARAAPYDRDKALDAAMAVFWEKGFHATSLKDLEGVLGMKPGSIYAAFISKENLFLLALAKYFEGSRKGFRAQMAQAPSPLAGLAAHLRKFALLGAGDAARRACMLTKTLVDTRTTDPAIAGITQEYMGEMQAEFEAVFKAAQSAGELGSAADPARLARRYQANVTALRLALDQGLDSADFKELAEDMALEVEELGSSLTAQRAAKKKQAEPESKGDDRQFSMF
ncbi:TetR/AcrR family transcriptional regulator [Sulfitobacter guttiformis]|uniref:TetR family transcriptional regulator n=1 Tax=Sulfitobacter guttiformis TaxID=74349 RepID=A0A420DNH2_9RHOB|nr:TetR/AcrR family transcriptional regulator [Sulfitobacter guttiformis]KIN73047.1 putative transcriptional regulator, TetR family [Sulfitobacter guttiformis KCTC 32187]RKE95733.1 TetR family transcriptional regulator [Sulfitobacter guttiformis]